MYLIGGRNRHNQLVTIGGNKIWFFLKTSKKLTIQSFFESSKAWTNEDKTVKYIEEMNFILTNKKDWDIVLQRPGEVMEHCGAFLHAACTIVQKSNPVCVSIGFQTSTAIALLSFLENVPQSEKGFQSQGKIKPATTTKRGERGETRVNEQSLRLKKTPELLPIYFINLIVQRT